MEWLETAKEWFLGLGAKYHVNPIIFGSIYVGAIPFFFASLWWIIRNLKNKKSVVPPVLSAGFFFLSAYLYLLLVGRNIPAWVYLMVGVLIFYGSWSTIRTIKRKMEKI
ncbi:MAG: hypothetical protein ABIY90_11700 [Puia sp.]